MSLTIEEFEVLYPAAFHWGSFKLHDDIYGPVVGEEGFLKFTAKSAAKFSRAFDGNHVMFAVKDYTDTICRPPGGSIKLILENDKYYQENRDSRIDSPTSAKPYSLYLCGTDDISYTKFYSSMKEVTEELELLKSFEPLEFKDIIELGFVFTN